MDNTILKSLLVPGSLSFLLIVVGYLMAVLLRSRWGKRFIILGVAAYYFFSITIGADLIIKPLEENYSTLAVESMDQAEIIVVLSGGRLADTLRSSEVLRISNIKNHDADLIISGTQSLDPDRESASAIESFFINRGVNEERIHVEDESRNTRQNAEKVFEIIGEEPFFLVTSAYHMNRSIKEFEKLGADPIPAPTDFRGRGAPYGIRDFIPNSGNLRKSDLAMHEYFGILYYRIFRQ